MDLQSRPSGMNVRHKPCVWRGWGARKREWRRLCSKRVHETCNSDEAMARERMASKCQLNTSCEEESGRACFLRLQAFLKQLFDWVLWRSENFAEVTKLTSARSITKSNKIWGNKRWVFFKLSFYFTLLTFQLDNKAKSYKSAKNCKSAKINKSAKNLKIRKKANR
jgi:hypothetical protein